MSAENVELARRGYELLNEVYKTGDLEKLSEAGAEVWDPEIVLATSGTMPEHGEWHGHDGMLRFVAGQMEAFEQMWVEPEDFIDAGDMLIVPVRFGGRSKHAGLEVEFSTVHGYTLRDGKVLRLQMYPDKQQALEAAGLEAD